MKIDKVKKQISTDREIWMFECHPIFSSKNNDVDLWFASKNVLQLHVCALPESLFHVESFVHGLSSNIATEHIQNEQQNTSCTSERRCDVTSDVWQHGLSSILIIVIPVVSQLIHMAT